MDFGLLHNTVHKTCHLDLLLHWSHLHHSWQQQQRRTKLPVLQLHQQSVSGQDIIAGWDNWQCVGVMDVK